MLLIVYSDPSFDALNGRPSRLLTPVGSLCLTYGLLDVSQRNLFA